MPPATVPAGNTVPRYLPAHTLELNPTLSRLLSKSRAQLTSFLKLPSDSEELRSNLKSVVLNNPDN